MDLQKVTEVQSFLQKNPGYFKWGNEKLAMKLDCSVEEAEFAKKNTKSKYRITDKSEYMNNIEKLANAIDEFYGLNDVDTNIVNLLEKCPTSIQGESEYKWKIPFQNELTKDECFQVNNILIIGDLHSPFERVGYLDFCKKIYKKYNCNKVVFIGDIIDNHFSSFHDTDPDGHSAAEELRLAKLSISKWYETFPKAKVCLGNHDNIPVRKAFNGGMSSAWIKSVSEVLNTPEWEYSDEFIIDDVLYTHGISRKASARMQADLTSVVQGHYHSEGYIQYSVGRNYMNLENHYYQSYTDWLLFQLQRYQ